MKLRFFAALFGLLLVAHQTLGQVGPGPGMVPLPINASACNTYATWDGSNFFSGSGSGTLSGGNLTDSLTSNQANASTVSFSSSVAKKFYWEVTWSSGSFPEFGIANSTFTSGGAATGMWGIYQNGSNLFLGNGTNYGNAGSNTPSTAGDIILVAVDTGAQKLWVGRRRSGTTVWIGGGDPGLGTSPTASAAGGGGTISTALSLAGTWYAMVGNAGSWVAVANFGASAFSGTLPTGFTGLCQ